ncbi:MAG: hypothetical protein LBD25_02200 [Coriobacteriales bacterium]|jgi:hypothetical protein|nr:hypothetical protein [Coriobacteriales bacterium]
MSGPSTNLGAQNWGATQGGNDALAVRLDGTGEVLWARAYGGTGDESFRKVAALPSGGFVAVGDSDAPSTSLGAHDWGSAGDDDAIAVCLDDTGGVRWARSIDSSAADSFSSVAVSPGGLVVSVGESMGAGTDPAAPSWGLEGYRDAVAVGLDGVSGEVLWARNYGGQGADEFRAVDALHAGGFVAAGAASGPSTNLGEHNWGYAGDWDDGIVVMLDDAGDATWSVNAGCEINDVFLAVSAAGDGFIAAGWSYWESANLGEHNWGHVGTGDQGDAIVVRFGTELPPRPTIPPAPSTPSAPPAQLPAPDAASAIPATGDAAAPWLAAAAAGLAASGVALIARASRHSKAMRSFKQSEYQ